MIPLSQHHSPSLHFSYSPFFVESAIHNGNLIRNRSGSNGRAMPMRHSTIGKRFLFSKTEQGDCPCCDLLDDMGPAASWRRHSSCGQLTVSYAEGSRKRMRPSLTMNANRDEETAGNANKRENGRSDIRGRREPTELSFFDKLIDKALLLDDSSPDSGSSFPVMLTLLTIITTSILPDATSRVLFIGLFLCFSLLTLYLSLLSWDDDRDDESDNSNASISFDDGNEDRNGFQTYYLSIGYLGALLLTSLLKPFDFETVGVVQQPDSLFLTTTIVIVSLLGVLSSSGLILFPKNNRRSSIDKEDEEIVVNEEDYVALSLSTEKSLMDIWDQELQREELSEDQDN